MKRCGKCGSPNNRPTQLCFNCENAQNPFFLKSIQYSEDRSRFFRNSVDGTDYAYSLGCRMPDSRNERNRLYDAMGAEPVTRGSMPQSWKENQEYAEHVRNGGERDTFKNIDISGGKKVIDQLRKGNVRIPS